MIKHCQSGKKTFWTLFFVKAENIVKISVRTIIKEFLEAKDYQPISENVCISKSTKSYASEYAIYVLNDNIT